MPFYTEKQTEDWLQSETRVLPMPDGTVRTTTAFKLVWNIVDSLILNSGFSPTELAGYAIEEAALQRIDFDTAFRVVVAYLDNRRRDAWGI